MAEAHADETADDPVLIELRPLRLVDRERVLQDLADGDIVERLRSRQTMAGTVAVQALAPLDVVVEVIADDLVPGVTLIAIGLLLRGAGIQLRCLQPPRFAIAEGAIRLGC